MSEVWQHPYVDVFKKFELWDWKNSKKIGDVNVELDNDIGRKIVTIKGAIWANHYFILPYHQAGIKSLGLTGRYIYLGVCGIDSRQFTIHLDFAFNESKNARISLSNIYKEEKYDHFSVQAPLNLAPGRWAVVCLDALGLLDRHHCMKPGVERHYLRTIMMCANLKVSRIGTSDTLYSPHSLPRDLNFKLAKAGTWDKCYDWFEPLKCDRAQPEDKPAMHPVTKPAKPKRAPLRSAKKEKLADDKENKELLNNAEMKEEAEEAKERRPQQGLVLKDTIGCSLNTCPTIQWSKNLSHKELVFASGSTAVAMDLSLHKRFFKSHSRPLVALCVGQQGDLLCTADEGSIKIWNFFESRCLATWNTEYCLKFVSISSDSSMLATVGKDSHNHDVVTIWDLHTIAKLTPYQPCPQVIANQISQFNILCLKFAPEVIHTGEKPSDETQLQLCSCGQENIRFWRIKKRKLRFAPVVLDKSSRNTVFTSLDYEGKRRVYVGSKEGTVLQINAESQELEFVFKLHDSGIHSVAVNEAFCVTGSDDLFLRVWPLDFSEFFIEAKHEGTIQAVDISPDGVEVACGTEHGSIGHLDISQQKYRTVVRSHTGSIISMDCLEGRVVTVSLDRTIRIWDIGTLQQVYEFCSFDDQAVSVALHPAGANFACGFSSGTLRIFDIEKTAVTDELRFFDRPLDYLKYLQRPGLLLVVAADGSFAVLSAVDYHMVKQVLLEAPTSSRGCAVSPSEDTLAAIGKSPNSVTLWSLSPVEPRRSFTAGSNPVRGLAFTSDKQLAIITGDQKVKLYNTEGSLLYQANVNLGQSMTKTVRMVAAPTGNHLAVIGNDSKIRLVALPNLRTALLPLPPSCNVREYSGHTETINSAMFYHKDPSILITAAECVNMWHFKIREDSAEEPVEPPQDEEEPWDVSVLVNPAKANLVDAEEEDGLGARQEASARNEKRAKLNLPKRHFVCCQEEKAVFYDELSTRPQSVSDTMVEARGVVGYNGNAHDNIVWNRKLGWFCFSVGNKLVLEEWETRRMEIWVDQEAEISTLAMSPGYVATATGIPNKSSSVADLCVYQIEPSRPYLKLHKKLAFHEKGVQCLMFVGEKHLVSIGRHPECSVAVWDLAKGVCVSSTLLEVPANSIAFAEREQCFYAVGRNKLIKILMNGGNLLCDSFELGEKSEEFDFALASIAIAPSSNTALIGSTKGTVLEFDLIRQQFVGEYPVSDSEISYIDFTQHRIMVSAGACVMKWETSPTTFISARALITKPVTCAVDSHVVAMDASGVEGLIGTNSGSVFHLDISKSQVVRIKAVPLNSHLNSLCIFMDPKIMAVAATDCSITLLNRVNCDEVTSYLFPDAHCSHLLSYNPSLLVGCFSDGCLRVVSSSTLQMLGKIRVSSVPLTAAVAVQKSLIIGDELGAVFLASCASLEPLSFRTLKLMEREGAITDLQFKQEEKKCRLVVCTSQGTVSTWERWLKKGEEPLGLASEYALVNVDQFSLLESPYGVEVPELDLQVYKEKQRHNAKSLFTTLDFDLLLCCSDSLQYLYLRNLRTHEIFKRIPIDVFPVCMTLVRDSHWVGIGSKEGTLQLRHLVENHSHNVRAHFGEIASISVDPEFARIVTAGRGEIIVWDLHL